MANTYGLTNYDYSIRDLGSSNWNGGGRSSTNTSPSTATNLTGTAYDVPDPTASATTAIAGTNTNLGSLYNLAGQVNQQNTQQTAATANADIPGYTANMNQWASDISDLLAGKISSGTKYNLAQSAAERGISTGTGGSQSNNSAWLRALGLTEEGLKQQGGTELSSMIGSAIKSPTMDVSQYFTTPSDVQSAQYAADVIASNQTTANRNLTAAQYGLNTGTSMAGSTAQAGGGGGSTSSISQLLSQILGTGSGGSGAGTANNSGIITAQGGSGSSGWSNLYDGGYDSLAGLNA